MGGLAGHLGDRFRLIIGVWDAGTPHNELGVELSFCAQTSRMLGAEGAAPGYLFSVNPLRRQGRRQGDVAPGKYGCNPVRGSNNTSRISSTISSFSISNSHGSTLD